MNLLMNLRRKLSKFYLLENLCERIGKTIRMKITRNVRVHAHAHTRTHARTNQNNFFWWGEGGRGGKRRIRLSMTDNNK